jgi:hypothetical protein
VLNFKINFDDNSTTSNDSFEIIEECSATSEKLEYWNQISGWYPSIISYIIPVIVICFCYIRILMYLSSKSRNLREGSVSQIIYYTEFYA